MKTFIKTIFGAVLAMFCLSACSEMLPIKKNINRVLVGDTNPIVIDEGSYVDATFWVENEKTGEKQTVKDSFYSFHCDDEQFAVEFLSLSSNELKIRITNIDPNRGSTFLHVVLECKDGNQFTDRFEVYTRYFFENVPVMEFENNKVSDDRYCLSIQVLKLDKTPKVIKWVRIWSENNLACSATMVEDIYEEKYDFYYTPVGHGSDTIYVDTETIDGMCTSSGVGVDF